MNKIGAPFDTSARFSVRVQDKAGRGQGFGLKRCGFMALRDKDRSSVSVFG